MITDVRQRAIEKAISPIVDRRQWELVELTCSGPNCRTHVHVFVHGKNGVSASDIGKLHREIEELIDSEGILDPGSYQLEVGTPGLDRPLRTPRDFSRNLGRRARLFLERELGGCSEWEGEVCEVTCDCVHLRLGTGELRRFPIGNLRFGKLVIDPRFGFPKKKKKKKKRKSRRSSISSRN